MCTRFACALDHNDIRKACSYQVDGIHRQPEWVDSGEVYAPSYNICAHESLPVLVSGSLVDSNLPRVLMPMKWGMIPSWHSGVSSKLHHRLDTTVCRAEAVSVSRFCGKPFHHGRRCVVVCDGFYQWQHVTSGPSRTKRPFFVFKEQADGVNILDNGPWTWNAKSGWFGPSLLNIAGIFDTWVSALDEVYYSFTVLTTVAHPSLSWLSQRLPAILDTEADVDAWLDSGRVSATEALTRLVPVGSPTVRWHSVSKHVNSWKNKDSLCNWPCNPDTTVESNGRKRPNHGDGDEEETSQKRPNKTALKGQKRGGK